MTEIEDILFQFARKHGLDGEDGCFLSAEETIHQSDAVQQELTELVCSLYKTWIP